MRAWVVVVAVVAACSKHESKRTPAPAVPPPRAAASSTAELDALWALAPADTRLAFVASADGLDALERRYRYTRPMLAKMSGMIAELEQMFGTSDLSRANFGLPRGRAVAAFVTASALVVLPVADADKLGARLQTKLACKQLANRLACATGAAALDTLGGGKVGIGDVGERGEIEVAVALDDSPLRASAVVQLSPGTAVVHGAIANIPNDAAVLLGTASKPSGDLAHAGGFFIADLRRLLADAPPGPARDLVQTFAGPIAGTMPAGHGALLDLRVRLSDTAAAQRLINSCPTWLGAVGATVARGTCHVPQLPLAVPQPLDIWVQDSELRIGDRAAKPAAAVALGPLGELVARSAWSFAVYGHGTLLGTAVHDQFLQAGGAGAGLAAFEEVAVAARLDGTTVRLLLGASTVWANPEDVARQLAALVQTPTSKRGAEVAAIAARAPSSPFARAHRAGETGITGAVLFSGLLFSVVIPMYLDRLKTHTVGAPVTQLQQLAAAADEYRRTKGTYPVGNAALRPDAPCCKGPRQHCPVVSWVQPLWQQLHFSLDKPSLFQYAYRSDGKTFTATAIGDLDCDGISVIYTLTGNADGTTTLTEPTPGSD